MNRVKYLHGILKVNWLDYYLKRIIFIMVGKRTNRFSIFYVFGMHSALFADLKGKKSAN